LKYRYTQGSKEPTVQKRQLNKQKNRNYPNNSSQDKTGPRSSDFKPIKLKLHSRGKVDFPSMERRLSSEDFTVSDLPNFPGCNCKSFHEVPKMPLWFGLLNCVKERQMVVPMNVKQVPTSPLSKRALENQMICEFFQSWGAENSGVIIPFDREIPPSEQISGVDPISKDQPNKIFDFFRYLCFPNPIKRNRGFYVFEAKGIKSRRRVLIVSPYVTPHISVKLTLLGLIHHMF
jgi:hypothetical protein